jgi:hypothetical protein
LYFFINVYFKIPLFQVTDGKIMRNERVKVSDEDSHPEKPAGER